MKGTTKMKVREIAVILALALATHAGPSNGLLTPLETAPVKPHALNWESLSAAFIYQRTATSALARAPSTISTRSFPWKAKATFS
jgi:hypothetical protein